MIRHTRSVRWRRFVSMLTTWIYINPVCTCRKHYSWGFFSGKIIPYKKPHVRVKKNLSRNEEERGGGKGDRGIILFARRGVGGGDYVNSSRPLKDATWCIRIHKNYILSVSKIHENWIYNIQRRHDVVLYIYFSWIKAMVFLVFEKRITSFHLIENSLPKKTYTYMRLI